MRRRGFLAAAGASAALVVGGGRVAAGSTGASAGLEPAGSVEVRHASEGVVGDDGTTVYVAAGTGFATVDVSTPSSPTVLAERRDLTGGDSDLPWEGIRDVSVSGDRLLVAGPANHSKVGYFSGFQLFDVSDPAAPSLVASVSTRYAIHNAYLDGETAYVTGTGLDHQPLVVYDVSGDDPEQIAEWSVLDVDDRWGAVDASVRSCHDVHVQDGVAYVANWDAGTWLLDVSDPSSPRATYRLGGRDPGAIPSTADPVAEVFELPGNSHYARPNEDGTLLAVGREAFDFDETERTGGPAGITLWDLTRDPPAPVATLAPPAMEDEELPHTAHNFAFRGDTLYTSWYSGGVRVYRVDGSSQPLLVDAWKDEAHASFWTAVPTASGFAGVSYADLSVEEEKRREEGVGDRLYTFPEPNGEPSPASLSSPNVTASEVTAPPPTTTETTTTTTTTTSTTTETTPETTETTPETTQTTAETTTGGQPGFGALAALGAGSLAVWRRLAGER